MNFLQDTTFESFNYIHNSLRNGIYLINNGQRMKITCETQIAIGLHRNSRKTVHGYWQLQILAGVILGGICTSLMIASFWLKNDLIFDTHSVLLSFGGLFLGLVLTIFTLTTAFAYHYWFGGTGTYTGIWVILATDCIPVCASHHGTGNKKFSTDREVNLKR